MVTLPLTDSTEARYAQTAYLMAQTNDWITPYYDVGIPFWGKPPFSFWAEAAAYQLFGMQDFSARVPALLFTFLTMGLIFTYLKTFYNRESALWGAVIYLTSLLPYSLSGAVLTDPYLTFATTLSMISLIMLIKGQKKYWGYLFFIGLTIGLLAKGPLALVIVGGSMTFWLLFDFKERLLELKKLPWFSGTLLMLLLTLPWYILAELKTPGFLDYFIIGEHFKRFVDSGWSGDLYGSSHTRAHGVIWLLWLQASFPWVLIALYALFKNSRSKTERLESFQLLRHNSAISYLVMCSIFVMTFFSVAGNVLWTYTLPALPALAILLAIYLQQKQFQLTFKKFNLIYLYALFVPVLLFIANIYLLNKPNTLPTEKQLIEHYKAHAQPGEPLYYVIKRPFSAQYYSKGEAIVVASNKASQNPSNRIDTYAQLRERINKTQGKSYIAIQKKRVKVISQEITRPMKKLYENKRFVLFEI